MSDLLTLALGIAGAYFAPVGYAAYGFLIGTAVGSAIDAAGQPDKFGPQLDDLRKGIVSQYGVPINKTWGVIRVPANIIWSTDKVPHEHRQSTGGGGIFGDLFGDGPDVVTFTYSVSVALLVGEGPIGGISRIWANKRLIYDVRSTALTEQYPGVFSTAFGASPAIEGAVVVYTGNETQEPDPTIVAYQGSSPAYRGYCYVVINGLDLSEYFGNQVPTFEVEVGGIPLTSDWQTLATIATGTLTGPSNFGSTVWGLPYEYNVLYNPIRNEIWVSQDNRYTNGSIGSNPYNNPNQGRTDRDIIRLDADTGEVLGYIDTPNTYDSTDLIAPFTFYFGAQMMYYSPFDHTILVIQLNPIRIQIGDTYGIVRQGVATLYDAETMLPTSAPWYIPNGASTGFGGSFLDWNFRVNPYDQFVYLWAEKTASTTKPMAQIAKDTGAVLQILHPIVPSIAGGQNVFSGAEFTPLGFWYTCADKYLRFMSLGTGAVQAFDLSEGTSAIPVNRMIYAPDINSLFIPMDPDGVNTNSYNSATYIVVFNCATHLITHVDLGSFAFPSASAGMNIPAYDATQHIVWFCPYKDTGTNSLIGISTATLAVTQNFTVPSGTMADGTTITTDRGSRYPIVGSGGDVFVLDEASNPASYNIKKYAFATVDYQTADLADIVADLCDDAGLSTAQYNVTDLVGTVVRGYARTRVSSARDNIEPLMTAFFFDAVESDGDVKFVMRLHEDPVGEFAWEDLGAHEDRGGNDDATAPRLTVVRTPELEHPREVQSKYMDWERDYEINTQYARLQVRDADGVVTIDNPIVFNSDEAWRVAQVNLLEAWVQRTKFTWSTTRGYSDFEPSDVVTITTDTGIEYIIRITSKKENPNGVIDWEGMLEDPWVYKADDFDPNHVSDLY
jgi:hypothetical protein